MNESRAVSPRFCSTLLITALAALTVHCGGDGGGVTPPDEPSIGLSSTAVSFSATAGGAASGSQTVEITNRGSGTLSGLAIVISYTAGQPTGWLSGTLSQTTAPSTLTVTANPGSIPEGSYTAGVAVSSGTANNSPQTVSVTFTVAPSAGGAAVIALSSNSQSFSAQQGGANPPPQAVQVTNAAGGTLNGLAASVSYTASQPTGWLAASLGSTEAPSTLTLDATTGGLTAGTYSASVAVTSPVASNNPQTINVTFTVAPSAGGAAVIALSSNSQSFSAQQGGANPPPQTVQVTNSGGGILSGLAVSVSYTAGPSTDWLTASLSSAEAPSTLTLTATTASLTEGTYVASVAVTSSAASNSPQAVTVTLVVAPPAGSPSITLSPSDVTFRALEGGADPGAQTVDVTNGGSGTLSGLAVGTITYGAGSTGWLAATLSGTTAPVTLTLGATTGSLGAGAYTATVPITSSLPGVSSQNVNVSFVVTSTSTTGGILVASFAGSSDLYVVEPSASGRDVLQGPIQTADGVHPVIVDLALAPGSILYGISFTTLYTINPSTGAAVEVGSLGLGTANALAFGDGKLFGATSGGSFFEVDVATGQATERGSFGGGLLSDGDIVFAPDGTLFGAALQQGDGVLVTIDPATGQATPVDPGTPIGFENLYGLAYFEGELFGVTTGTGSAQGELIKIAVSSGTATLVRSLSFDAGGAGAARPAAGHRRLRR